MRTSKRALTSPAGVRRTRSQRRPRSPPIGASVGKQFPEPEKSGSTEHGLESPCCRTRIDWRLRAVRDPKQQCFGSLFLFTTGFDNREQSCYSFHIQCSPIGGGH